MSDAVMQSMLYWTSVETCSLKWKIMPLCLAVHWTMSTGSFQKNDMCLIASSGVKWYAEGILVCRCFSGVPVKVTPKSAEHWDILEQFGYGFFLLQLDCEPVQKAIFKKIKKNKWKSKIGVDFTDHLLRWIKAETECQTFDLKNMILPESYL